MKIIIRAELVTDWGESTMIDVAQFDRPVHVLAPESLRLRLTMAKSCSSRCSRLSFPLKLTSFVKSAVCAAVAAEGRH